MIEKLIPADSFIRVLLGHPWNHFHDGLTQRFFIFIVAPAHFEYFWYSLAVWQIADDESQEDCTNRINVGLDNGWVTLTP